MFANWTVHGEQHSMQLKKTGCTSKISQISGFQNHLQKVSSLHISICQPIANSKKPVCDDGPCSSKIEEKSSKKIED